MKFCKRKLIKIILIIYSNLTFWFHFPFANTSGFCLVTPNKINSLNSATLLNFFFSFLLFKLSNSDQKLGINLSTQLHHQMALLTPEKIRRDALNSAEVKTLPVLIPCPSALENNLSMWHCPCPPSRNSASLPSMTSRHSRRFFRKSKVHKTVNLKSAPFSKRDLTFGICDRISHTQLNVPFFEPVHCNHWNHIVALLPLPRSRNSN